MTELEFYNELEKIDIFLNDIQKEQFKKYYEYLIEYNSHTNLTSIIEKKDVYLKHFYDSILLSKTQDFTKIETVLDIGCGAGFPGLVLKIIYPNVHFTLLDSNNKKIIFCKKMINILNLKKIDVVHKRAEEYILNQREIYDIATARAVKNLQILSELAIPFVKKNGYFIAMKSDYKEELKQSMNAINKLGGKYLKTINLNLPLNKGERNFIIIKKIKETDTKFPRLYKQIIKKPL